MQKLSKPYQLVKFWEYTLFFVFNTVSYFRYFFLKNSSIKNLHTKRKSEECFIVLPGLSSEGFDMASLQPHDVITTNYYFTSKEFTKILPKFHIISDRKFFETPSNNDKLRALSQSVNVVANGRYCDISDSKNVYRFYPIYRVISNRIKLDFSKPCSNFSTIALTAIAFSIYVGYKKINLIGFDLPPGYLPHVYKTSIYQENEIKKEQNKVDEYSYCELFWQYTNCQHEAYKLASYAKINKVKILNHSDKSYVKAFDKV